MIEAVERAGYQVADILKKMKTSKSNFLGFLMVLPLCISCVYLFCLPINHSFECFFSTSIVRVVIPLLLGFLVATLFTIGIISRRRKYFLSGCLLMCSCTPLAVIFPWILVPDNLGMSLGSYLFFLDWLKKYPDFWGVNVIVLIGILCVLLASMVPAMYAYCHVFKRKNKKTAWILFALEIGSYFPVLIKSDYLLLMFGLLGIWHKKTSTEDILSLNGALLRLISFLIVLVLFSKNFLGNSNHIRKQKKVFQGV